MNDQKSTNTQKLTEDMLRPEMMGDGTEEQNLGEKGNPAARIKMKG